MGKRLSYRKAKKGIAEQYGINLPKKALDDMGVSPANREVKIIYDEKNKVIKIKMNKR